MQTVTKKNYDPYKMDFSHGCRLGHDSPVTCRPEGYPHRTQEIGVSADVHNGKLIHILKSAVRKLHAGSNKSVFQGQKKK